MLTTARHRPLKRPLSAAASTVPATSTILTIKASTPLVTLTTTKQSPITRTATKTSTEMYRSKLKIKANDDPLMESFALNANLTASSNLLPAANNTKTNNIHNNQSSSSSSTNNNNTSRTTTSSSSNCNSVTASVTSAAALASSSAAITTTTTPTAAVAAATTSFVIGESATSTASHNNSQAPPPPLRNFSLRGNQLCGSILIGNYNYLTQLEVSENEMEILDLSSLAQLETLKCSHNKLTELMINGSNLITVIANHNGLHTITASPPPDKLVYLDISHNDFVQLPAWIGSCCKLLHLKAQHNQVQKANDFFATFKINALKTLNLAFNRLRNLPSMLPEKCASIEELYLQSNELQHLPDNFFYITRNQLRLLNASCNKLTTLTAAKGKPWHSEDGCFLRLEQLYLSSNQLNERIFHALQYAVKLRVLHLAYNKIGDLSEMCLRKWSDLEVLVLSGNLLQHLPESITILIHLRELRVHSNLLLSTPMLAKLVNLKVLDLAHNHLDHVNLLSIMPKNLKYLDLSCNMQLQVDERQVKVCQSQRNWSLVDVSGKNRACLPTTKIDEHKENNCTKPPWSVGFSETPGGSRKLYASQVRCANFHSNEEGLFGIIESSATGASTKNLAKLLPKILQQERMVKETLNEYMKYTLLAVQQKLNCDSEVSADMGAAICHISRETNRAKDYVRPHKCRRFILRVASVGDVQAYLVRKTINVLLTPHAANDRLGDEALKPTNFPDPAVSEVVLSNNDEYLIICNSHLWSVMDIERATREIRKEENPILAAKRLQDIAQSFGALENLSVLVVKFRNIGTDVERLIRELKKTVRRKPAPIIAPPASCCDGDQACRHRSIQRTAALMQSSQQSRQLSAARSDRSSPSGQSDQALSPLLCKETSDGNDEFILAHARVLEEADEMEMLDETDSALSEEQFKCWEYMLEQNTQLLFDKELNTISKSFTKNNQRVINERKLNRTPDGLETNQLPGNSKTNLLRNVHNKFISSSTPQLLYAEVKKPKASVASAATGAGLGPVTNSVFLQQNFPMQQMPTTSQQQMSFLSKHFGSSRSFQASSSAYNIFDLKNRDSLAMGCPIPYSKLGGGPNAAYFGSLQRLMPYNLEYDFAVMQERGILDEDDEYAEHENRMRNYWGVATTEL